MSHCVPTLMHHSTYHQYQHRETRTTSQVVVRSTHNRVEPHKDHHVCTTTRDHPALTVCVCACLFVHVCFALSPCGHFYEPPDILLRWADFQFRNGSVHCYKLILNFSFVIQQMFIFFIRNNQSNHILIIL